MGLGLVMVKRLMASFGGMLRISNAASGPEQPSGAVVELVFRAERDAAPVTQVGAVCGG